MVCQCSGHDQALLHWILALPSAAIVEAVYLDVCLWCLALAAHALTSRALIDHALIAHALTAYALS